MSEHVDNFFQLIKDKDVEFVDFRFTATSGKFHHITYTKDAVTESLLSHGIAFDGSSIDKWNNIKSSDAYLSPDLHSAYLDPFTAESTLAVICDVVDAGNSKPHLLDPRSTLKRAESYLANSKIASNAFFGPELEFFVFDDVKYKLCTSNQFFSLFSDEEPSASPREYAAGNFGHRALRKGSYMSSQPIDVLHDVRSEILNMLRQVNITPVMHHHEVSPSQYEIGMKYDSAVVAADNVQKAKYVIKSVAHSYGKTASFMPKPMAGENGSGMHTHISLFDGNNPLFHGKDYAHLSEMALYFIGGILKHIRALNAFANQTTNSYKRLVPGYEAPVHASYCASNRSAAIRIPHFHNSANSARIECRFPDPLANPYLLNAALLMAGIDGIKNKIKPSKPSEDNAYEHEHHKDSLSPCLNSALGALEQDHEFLIAGNVFSKQQIEHYISLKKQDVFEAASTPTPLEYKLYYNG